MKICSFCKKNFSNEKFRKIKRKNWQGFYPRCTKCESISMKERYEKNPIPQMLSNAKIRAKQKSIDFNLTSEYLKKSFPKTINVQLLVLIFNLATKIMIKKITILLLR